MIITICKSMRFAKEMLQAKILLEQKRHKVFVGPLVKHYVSGRLLYKKGREGAKLKIVHNLIKVHFKKIEKSDAVLVLNYTKGKVKNYIGGNTLMEVGFAFYLGKKIYFLNPIPRQSYREELIAMKPIILHGNLERIK